MRRYFIIIFLPFLWVIAQEMVYVRYYRNENDFLKGKYLLATERFGKAHIRVGYNKIDQPVEKDWFDDQGVIQKKELYEYHEDGSLYRRVEMDGNENVLSQSIYGDEEEMSAAFIAYVFPHRNPGEFVDRITVYSYGIGGEIESYHFMSVDQTEFGSITYQYNPSGLLTEERWKRLPEGKTMRLFQYKYEPETRFYELFEYDSTGSEVSHVGLPLPVDTAVLLGGRNESMNRPDIQRGRSSSGNVLEEVTEILEDIRKHKTHEGTWYEGENIVLWETVKDSPDVIYLKNGDELRVNLIQISEKYVRFSLIGESDTLNLPLHSVGEIERRDGEILYPIIYPTKN